MSPMPLPSTSTRARGIAGRPRGPCVFVSSTPVPSSMRNTRSGGSPTSRGQTRVPEQVAILAVDGQEVARAREVQHELEVFLARVPGHVHERVVLVEHLGAEPVERVDDAAHRALVAGDHARGDDHEVAALDLDVLVLAGRHQGQRRVRLALAPRREDDLPLPGSVTSSSSGASTPSGICEEPSVDGHVHVALHAHAEQRHPPAVRGRQREHLLDPMDVRGERGEDDAARRRARSGARRAWPTSISERRVARRGRRWWSRSRAASTPCSPSSAKRSVVGRLAVERAAGRA